ncbi:PAS domain-containing protein [Streptomyces sp. NPDC003077]|uniref:PAS domain-containing protein n=1 Tax=Streptomyces sp. NPDC003077 TaxID=3154443 RepID=UPI0033ACC344
MSSRPSRGAARLAAILDALPDALLLVNCNGTVVNANSIALETFQAPGTALVGRGLLDLLPTFDSKRIPGSMRRPDEADDPGTRPTRMIARRTDGTEMLVEVTSANLEDGRTPYESAFEAAYADHRTAYTGDELLMLVVRDLTGTLDTEAELARQQRQTEMILRAAAEGVVGVDSEGRIVLVNPSAAQILGYRASELGGRKLHPLIHHSRPDGAPLAWDETPLADTLKSGRKHRVRNQALWAKDGRSVAVDLTTAPVRDGDQLVGAVMTFTDRRPYDALAARHAQLLAVLDHALRGPLEELKAELGTLADDPAGQLWPEANQILRHLTAGYGRMTTLLDNVLDFQRLDAGGERLRRAKVSLESVVAAGVDGAVELIGPGRAQFAVHAPEMDVEVDAERLAQALAHLIADVAGVDATGRATGPASGATGQASGGVGRASGPAGGTEGAPAGDSTIVVAAARRGEVVRIEVRGPHSGGDPVHQPIVRGIVRRHGGVLQPHEVPGAGGSAYVLEVPVGAAAGPAADDGQPREATGNETTVMPAPRERARGTRQGGAAGASGPVGASGGAGATGAAGALSGVGSASASGSAGGSGGTGGSDGSGGSGGSGAGQGGPGRGAGGSGSSSAAGKGGTDAGTAAGRVPGARTGAADRGEGPAAGRRAVSGPGTVSGPGAVSGPGTAPGGADSAGAGVQGAARTSRRALGAPGAAGGPGVPDPGVPGSTGPGSAGPGVTGPGGAVPGGAVPGGAVPGGSGGQVPGARQAPRAGGPSAATSYGNGEVAGAALGTRPGAAGQPSNGGQTGGAGQTGNGQPGIGGQPGVGAGPHVSGPAGDGRQAGVGGQAGVAGQPGAPVVVEPGGGNQSGSGNQSGPGRQPGSGNQPAPGSGDNHPGVTSRPSAVAPQGAGDRPGAHGRADIAHQQAADGRPAVDVRPGAGTHAGPTGPAPETHPAPDGVPAAPPTGAETVAPTGRRRARPEAEPDGALPALPAGPGDAGQGAVAGSAPQPTGRRARRALADTAERSVPGLPEASSSAQFQPPSQFPGQMERQSAPFPAQGGPSSPQDRLQPSGPLPAQDWPADAPAPEHASAPVGGRAAFALPPAAADQGPQARSADQGAQAHSVGQGPQARPALPTVSDQLPAQASGAAGTGRRRARRPVATGPGVQEPPEGAHPDARHIGAQRQANDGAALAPSWSAEPEPTGRRRARRAAAEERAAAAMADSESTGTFVAGPEGLVAYPAAATPKPGPQAEPADARPDEARSSGSHVPQTHPSGTHLPQAQPSGENVGNGQSVGNPVGDAPAPVPAPAPDASVVDAGRADNGVGGQAAHGRPPAAEVVPGAPGTLGAPEGTVPAPTGRRRGRPSPAEALPQPPQAPAAPEEGGPAAGHSHGRAFSVRTLGQGVPFAQQLTDQRQPPAPGGPTPPGGAPGVPAAGSGRRRKLATPPEPDRTAPADAEPRPQAPAPAVPPTPAPPHLLGSPEGRAYAISAPDEGSEGPELLDGPNGAVEVTDRQPLPMDDELPPEPLDNPRRLLVWPAPDPSTEQALNDRGYRPVIVNSREEVDAQIAAYPAALFVDPLTGPITRKALQSLREAAVAAEVPVLVTAGLGQATREAAYGADPAVLLKALAPRDSEVHPPRVLLIEENDAIAGALTTSLERRGMQVARAASDADAIAPAAQTRPNLVVMDLTQVRRRRAGIVDWLRANGLLNRTPLVVYTSADLDPAQLPRLASGETVLFLAERSTSADVQSRIVDLLAKIGTN